MCASRKQRFPTVRGPGATPETPPSVLIPLPRRGPVGARSYRVPRRAPFNNSAPLERGPRGGGGLDPPLPKYSAEIFFRAFGQSKMYSFFVVFSIFRFTLAPSAPVCFNRDSSSAPSAPLKPQYHREGGWTHLHPPAQPPVHQLLVGTRVCWIAHIAG